GRDVGRRAVPAPVDGGPGVHEAHREAARRQALPPDPDDEHALGLHEHLGDGVELRLVDALEGRGELGEDDGTVRPQGAHAPTSASRGSAAGAGGPSWASLARRRALERRATTKFTSMTASSIPPQISFFMKGLNCMIVKALDSDWSITRPTNRDATRPRPP